MDLIWLTIDGPQTDQWLRQTEHKSFSQYHHGLTDQSLSMDQTSCITSSTDKHYSLDCENDFYLGCQTTDTPGFKPFFKVIPQYCIAHPYCA